MSNLDEYMDIDGYTLTPFRDGEGFGMTATSDNGTEISVFLSPEYARELAAWLVSVAEMYCA